MPASFDFPRLVLEENIFIEQLLPGALIRGLTEAEKAHYRAPFPDAASRKPVLAWPRQIPIAGEPVAWCRAQLPRLEVIDVGAGIHYLQEDQPHAIGRGLADWIGRLSPAPR